MYSKRLDYRNTFAYQQLEEEVRRDFDFYFIAQNLGIDVEEVMNWEPSKFERWRTYFKILLEEQKKSVEQTMISQNFKVGKHLFVFR